jgi:hypothetical protein
MDPEQTRMVKLVAVLGFYSALIYTGYEYAGERGLVMGVGASYFLWENMGAKFVGGY